MLYWNLDLVPLLTTNTINAPPIFNTSIGDGVVGEITCHEQTRIGCRFKPGLPHFHEGGSAVVRVLGRLQGLQTVDQSICRLLATSADFSFARLDSRRILMYLD